MVIYIHGFGGSGEGIKAKAFREYFQQIDEKFIAPSLSYNPDLAIRTLQELIELCDEDIYLIGSSLGGFYASYLASNTKVKKIVLINPALEAPKTLKKYIGDAKNFYDESTFEWNTQHIEAIKKYEPCLLHKERFMVLLQRDDDIIDYKVALEKLQGAKFIIESGGGHSFEGIEDCFEDIRAFFAIGKLFKHTSQVKKSCLKNNDLAKNLSDLYYDDLALFLDDFAKKLYCDALTDKEKNRVRLFSALENASKEIKNAAKYIQEAWRVSVIPTISWMEQNGYNKKPTIAYPKEIPHDFSFSKLKDLRFLYDDSDALPYRLEYNFVTDKNNLYEKFENMTKDYNLSYEEYLQKYSMVDDIWCNYAEFAFEQNVIKYYELQGFKIFYNEIKPIFHKYSPKYENQYILRRYVAVKEKEVFYFDIEEFMEEKEHSFIVFHYGDDTKELIEGDFYGRKK